MRAEHRGGLTREPDRPAAKSPEPGIRSLHPLGGRAHDGEQRLGEGDAVARGAVFFRDLGFLMTCKALSPAATSDIADARGEILSWGQAT